MPRHKDRPACEISCTLNLGGDEWPIFIDPTGGEGQEGVEVLLKQGDALLYRGCDLQHWREPFEGETCYQVFLHYNEFPGKYKLENLHDGRPLIGYPAKH